jgi:hypothetical protein
MKFTFEKYAPSLNVDTTGIDAFVRVDTAPAFNEMA